VSALPCGWTRGGARLAGEAKLARTRAKARMKPAHKVGERPSSYGNGSVEAPGSGWRKPLTNKVNPEGVRSCVAFCKSSP
jgi:hypothetical protein